MREIIVTADNTGVTPPVVLDQYISPFQVNYANSGSGTVQVTTTNPFPVSTTGKYIAPSFSWISAPASAPNTATYLTQPYRAIRLSGATQGDTLTVIQSGGK